MEIIQAVKSHPGIPVQSIYFGGGTPSMIPNEYIQKTISLIHELFQVQKDAEITLEANPEDITTENTLRWKEAGIQRLSIGIQSLDETDLKFMNRNHSAEQAQSAVNIALGSGIQSINVDLIFGSPWLTDTAWEKSMKWAFECGADHISAYALTIENKTLMNKKVQKGEWLQPDEEVQTNQYSMLYKAAESYGWDFYEISNLSKPGHRAKHNSNYWKNLPYLGFGPSAHSYHEDMRWWNIADNKKYTENGIKGEFLREYETLDSTQIYNEYILTNIRRSEGIHLPKLRTDPVCDLVQLEKVCSGLIAKGFAIYKEEHLILTLNGRLIADSITADLMV